MQITAQFFARDVLLAVAEHRADDVEHLAIELTAGVDDVPDAIFTKHSAFKVLWKLSCFAIVEVLLPLVADEIVVNGLNRLHCVSVKVESVAQSLNCFSGFVEMLLHGLNSLDLFHS